MYIETLEKTATHQKLQFRLTPEWLQLRGLTAETANLEMMRMALDEWLDSSGLALWREPNFVPEKQASPAQEAFCFRVDAPVISAPRLPELQGLKIDVPGPEPLPGLLESTARLQQDLADAQPVAGPAEWGMRLRLDLIGLVAGVPIPDSALSEAEWLLTPDLPVPELARHMLGLRPGQSKEIALKLPVNYPIAAWAGKSACYQVKLLGLERLRPPRLGPELARRAGFDSLNELEAHLIDEVQEQARRNWSGRVRDIALAKLRELMQPVLPKELVDAQMEQIWAHTLLPALKARGVSAPQIAKALPFWLQHRDRRRECTRNLGLGLVYKALITHFSLSLNRQEILAALAPAAEAFGLDVETAYARLAEEDRLQELIQGLLRAKADKVLMNQIGMTGAPRW